MSLSEKNIDEKPLDSTVDVASESALDELFKERAERKNSIPLDEECGVPEKKESIETKNVKNSKSSEKTSETKEPVEKPQDKKTTGKSVDDDDERELEIVKLKKALNDSQKWGHTNNKRIKNIAKSIISLKESGALRDDEFDSLNELLQTDPEEEELNTPKVSNNPMDKLISIANKRVDDLAELYEDDPLFKKKIESFDLFMENCTAEERDDIQEELENLEKTPLKLVKRMFQIGEKYYNEELKEIEESGGLKNFLSAKNSTIERMQKKIDKLEKQLLQYNDYDKPVLRIDELGDTLTKETLTDEPGNVMGSILRERDSRKKR